MKRLDAFNVLIFALFLAPAILALFFVRVMPQPEPSDIAPGIMTITASQVSELDAVFEALGYHWPPTTGDSQSHAIVPAIAVREMPVDIDTLTVDARKAIFFRVLAPLVAAENRQLREERDFLLQAFEQYPQLPKSGAITSRVRAIASRFNVSGNLDSPEVRTRLLHRVDIVPAALALAQAANESGWGRSRFTREANNLFGMWTWDKSQGIRPKERAKNARYFIRVFDSLRGSVSNYLHTINIGPAYRELRELRAASRARGEYPDAMKLAAGLTRYSARGEKYVDEIREIIEYNGLHELPPLRIEHENFAPAAAKK
ncbi:MAG TPA: glucosaminidase domain-containing protein [Gammaproteobacteria bacterium]